MNSITPVWYWRVNHEDIGFASCSDKAMTMTELNETPGLLTRSVVAATLAAVYKYYDNIRSVV